MNRFFRFSLLAGMAALGGCTHGDRGLVSPHQPVVSAAGATVPGCPDWSDYQLQTTEGQASNYGCATALNLAAMIADPQDLLHGRNSTGVGSGETASKAVKAFRETAPSGKGGTIATVSSKAGS